MGYNKDSMDAFDMVANELTSMQMEDLPEELEDRDDEIVEGEEDLDSTKEDLEDEDLDDTNKEDEGKESSTEDEDNLDEFSEDITKYVTEKLETKLGVSLGDFKDIDEVVDSLASMVEETSKSVFADPEIEKLNEFVRSGGNIKDFYSTVIDRVDPEKIDLDKEEDQRKIVRQNLKDNGYSDSQIERKIERYEDIDTLRDEAEEALEIIEKNKEKVKEKLLEETKKQHEEAKKRQQKFVSNVEKTIKETKDVKGIPVTEIEKKEVYRALLIPEADGKTKFQKLYESDAKYLIETAFFALKGDVLVKRAQTKGSSTTAKQLKEKMMQKSKRTKKSLDTVSGSMDALDMFSGFLRGI